MAERAEIVLSATDKTRAAFKSAQANLTSFKNSVTSGVALAARAFGPLGVAIGAAFQGISVKVAIDAADELGKLSQKTGVAVESLSALKYAGELSDVAVGDLADGFKKLGNNMVSAASGGKEAAAAFSAIGVKVTTAAGTLRNTDDVLGDVADRFAGYEDGAAKAALATELFGKNGAALIPFLNNGRAGLVELRDEAEKLGVVFGSDLAKKSEEFNDNMTRLSQAAKGVSLSMASDLLPALVAVTQQLLEGRKAYGSFTAALLDIGFNVDPFKSLRGNIVETQKELDKAIEKLADYQRQQQRVGSIPILGAIAERSTERSASDVQTLQARKRYLASLQAQEALATGAGITDTRAALRPGGTTKRQAPVVGGSGAAGGVNTAEALRRKVLDGEIKKIEISLENERDLFQNQNRRLADAFSDGALSIDQYFSRRTESQETYLERVRAGYDAEIKLLQDAQAKIAANKPQDRAEIQGRIEEAYAKQARAVREAAQATEEAERDRVRATGDFRAALRDLDAQIAELSGDTYAADLLRNAETLAQARGVLARAGGDPEREAQLAGLLRLQAEVNKSRQDYSLIVERAQLAEEAFLIQAERGGFTRQQVEQGVAALREDSLRQLDELIASTETLAAATKDPSVLAYFESLKLARAKAFDAKDPGLQRFNDLAREAGSSIARTLADAARNGGKLRDVLGSIGDKLLDIGTRELVEKPLEDAFTNLIKGVGKTAGAPGGAGGAVGPLQSILGAFGLGGTSPQPVQPAVASAGVDAAKALTSIVTPVEKVTSVLGALPQAAAVPLATSFAALTAAATSAAAALSLLASSSGASSAGGLASSIFGNGLGIENLFGGGFGSGAGFGFQDLGLFLHGGGVAGVSGGTLRNVSPLAWAGAERYHTGGMAGLAPDEVPAILRRGEEVLTQADPRHRYNGMGGDATKPAPVYNMSITVPESMSRKSATQMGAEIARRSSAASRRNG